MTGGGCGTWLLGLAALSGALCAGAAAEEASAPTRLGSPPLCEASAALRAPWDPGLVLVADNERRKELFAFTLVKGRLEGQRALPMPKGGRPRDIEALAAVGEGLLVVGSHSRKRDCPDLVECGRRGEREKCEERWRLRVLAHRDQRLLHVHAIESGGLQTALGGGVGACLKALFTEPPPAQAEAVCAALARAEAAASERACNTLDIEGAVAIPGTEGGADAASRVWLGLRSPLVEGRAVLLRLAAEPRLLRSLRVDAVVLLALGGRGIRELAARGTELFGIAGGGGDVDGPFALWRIPARELEPGAQLVPAALAEPLPAGSEGLVLDGGQALVVIDGQEGDENACRQPARQFRLPLP